MFDVQENDDVPKIFPLCCATLKAMKSITPASLTLMSGHCTFKWSLGLAKDNNS